jgi:hypothetical protein
VRDCAVIRKKAMSHSIRKSVAVVMLLCVLGNSFVAHSQVATANKTAKFLMLDPDYATSGIATFPSPLGQIAYSSITSPKAQSTNTVVAIENVASSDRPNEFLIGLDANGARNALLGPNGDIDSGQQVEEGDCRGQKIADFDLDRQDRTVALWTGPDGCALLRRYAPNGVRDASFAVQVLSQITATHKMRVITGADDSAYILVQENVMQSGRVQFELRVTHVLSNSLIDQAFGVAGTAVITRGSGDLVTAKALPTGQLIFVTQEIDFNINVSELHATRSTKTGQRDSSFGDSGTGSTLLWKKQPNLTNNERLDSAVRIDDNGRILVIEPGTLARRIYTATGAVESAAPRQVGLEDLLKKGLGTLTDVIWRSDGSVLMLLVGQAQPAIEVDGMPATVILDLPRFFGHIV